MSLEIVDEMLRKPVTPIDADCTIGDMMKYCVTHKRNCIVECYENGEIHVSVSERIEHEQGTVQDQN